MRTDRYRNVLLTIIAASLAAIAIPRIEAPEAMAAHGGPEGVELVEGQQGMVSPLDRVDTSVGASATSTMPLRWIVSWAGFRAGNYTWCSTAVVVTNTTGAPVDVDVEYITDIGSSIGLTSGTVYSNRTKLWRLQGDSGSTEISNYPFVAQHTTLLASEFYGNARVTASDPRVLVSAFQYCRNGVGFGGATLVSVANIPAYPVGATAEFFQAGMPATWTPPMAEVPE